jgi:hypothetical protein
LVSKPTFSIEMNPTFAPLDLNRPRLISKLKDLELRLVPFLNRSVYKARNIIIVSYVLSDLTTYF